MDLLSTAFALIKENENEKLNQLLIAQPELATSKLNNGISLLQFAAYARNTVATSIIRDKVVLLNIFEAVCLGEFSLVKEYIEQNPKDVDSFSPDGFTILGLASFFGHEEIVNLLLSENADPNIQANNQYMVTPLHSACAIGNINIAKALCEAGANVNTPQMQGVTALHSASNLGNLELVKLLIKFGADNSLKLESGETSFDMASKNDHKEVAKYLNKLAK